MNNKPTLEIIERGLRGNTMNNLINGWSFSIEEVSSNVYKVDGRDAQGHHVSGYGIDPENVLAKCVENARLVTQRTNILVKVKNTIAKKLKFKK